MPIMFSTTGLLGREFKHGTKDCFYLMRELFALTFGVKIPEVARLDTDGWSLNRCFDTSFYRAFRDLDGVTPNRWCELNGRADEAISGHSHAFH